jgi:hypothetical protein
METLTAATFISSVARLPQVYPETSGCCLEEPILFTANLSADEGTCILIFQFSNFGHFQRGGSLPLSSVEIEVCFRPSVSLTATKVRIAENNTATAIEIYDAPKPPVDPLR